MNKLERHQVRICNRVLAAFSGVDPGEALRARDVAIGQLRQDFLALVATQFRREGYFIEVGVGNGVISSNSYILEEHYGWTGLLVEPAQCFHASIRQHRRAHLETRAAYRLGGVVMDFMETDRLSTLKAYSGRDHHDRSDHQAYSVETVTLNTALEAAGAPKRIDFVSIDTEGSEFEVLRGFSLERYDVELFVIEHNEDWAKKAQIDFHLGSAGYKQILPDVSWYDAWYVKKSHPFIA